MRVFGCAIALACALAPGAAASQSAGSTARAWAIQVLVPGRAATGTRVLAAPAGAVAFDGAFAYPANGSVVRARSVATSVSASGGTHADSDAWANVRALSLFGGEITAARIAGEAHAAATPRGGSGYAGTSGIARLVVLGRKIVPTANRQISLGDWGYAIVLEHRAVSATDPVPGYRDFVTGLDVTLTAAHGGLPAGSELQIGYAEANAQAGARAALPPAPSNRPPEPGRLGIPQLLSTPPRVTPRLGQRGYVFPVYGVSRFVADTFGAFRGDVSGGWHHGDDIFAAVGTPVLAIADGVVFSVGWNSVGGWRLWLRDARGNEFYYAHLSAYSPLAVDGAFVRAGDVLGFVGDTGDAEGTPSHLHFEIHPVRLLGRGYDGAVDPTTYLESWRMPQDVRLAAAVGVATVRAATAAPTPGAFLVRQTDISSATGLVPRSLTRAAEGAGGPLLPRLQPPAAKPPVRGAP
jgi:murein DD-endopeptidase MepM/ murein hydrolase activator NlpD